MFKWIFNIKNICKCCGGKGELFKIGFFGETNQKQCPCCNGRGQLPRGFKADDDLIIREFSKGWKRLNCKYNIEASGIWNDLFGILVITENKY